MGLKDMFVSKEAYNLLKKDRDELEEITLKQNKLIVRLQEEVKQLNNLVGLYEACIQQGIKIDFPNSAGGGKEDDIDGIDIDFSDF